MTSTTPKAFLYLRRLCTFGLEPYLGAGVALIGLGYSLSIEDPLSYIPYGLCRTFEGVSETFPSLRVRRLPVFIRASQLAERWHLEAPFLNAYLLDRLCRETMTSRHFRRPRYQERLLTSRLPSGALDMSIETSDITGIIKDELILPSSTVILQDCSVDAPRRMEPAGGASQISNPLTGTSSGPVAVAPQRSQSSSITTLLLPLVAMKRWSELLCTRAHSAFLGLMECMSPEVWFATAQAFVERHLIPNDKSQPLTLATLDRISHLARGLDPYVRDIDRLSFVYLILSQFLCFAVSQKFFLDDLARCPGLEGDKLLLELIHVGLLATHRVAYWNHYEATVVTPEPPPFLPLASELRPQFSRGLWKRCSGKDPVAVLLRSFAPHSGPLKKELKADEASPKNMESALDLTAKKTASSRMIGSWSSLELAGDSRKRLRLFWHSIAASGPLRSAAERVVWKDELRRSAVDVAQKSPHQAKTSAGTTVAAARLQMAVTQTVQACEALKGAIRTLVKKLPSSPDEAEVTREVHAAIMTPRTLNPFSEVYGPSFALRCIHAFMDNAMGSFIMGVVTVASFWYFVDGFVRLPNQPNGWNALERMLRYVLPGGRKSNELKHTLESAVTDASARALNDQIGTATNPFSFEAPVDPSSFYPLSLMNDAFSGMVPQPYATEPYFYPISHDVAPEAHSTALQMDDALRFPLPQPPVPLPTDYVYLNPMNNASQNPVFR